MDFDRILIETFWKSILANPCLAQYEKGARSPKEKYLNALADIFEVSPHALAVPDIDSYVGLMHDGFLHKTVCRNRPKLCD